MFAAIENHADVVSALAEAGADLNAVSLQIETPDVKLGPNVVSDGARGSFPKGGMTPLLLAARHGSLDAARALVKAGADLNQPQSEGITPLIMAIFNAHYDLAAALVELGADVNKGDSSNRTPLYMAVDMHTLEWLFSRPTPRASGLLDSVDVVKLLLAKGAKPDARLTKRPPPIGIGGSGHNVNLTNGATPLMKAASSSDVELIKILLDAGADPNLTTDNHTTPLMMSAGLNWRDIGSLGTDEQSLEAIKIFLARGADVDAFNDDGMTALHGAAQRGSIAGAPVPARAGREAHGEERPQPHAARRGQGRRRPERRAPSGSTRSGRAAQHASRRRASSISRAALREHTRSRRHGLKDGRGSRGGRLRRDSPEKRGAAVFVLACSAWVPNPGLGHRLRPVFRVA